MSRLTAQDLYFPTCARKAVNPRAAGSKGYRSGLRMIPGGELIQNVSYAVALFSIIVTAVLIFLLEKTRLSKFYEWPFAGFRSAHRSTG